MNSYVNFVANCYRTCMPFETFKRQRLKSGQDPFVTIQRKGVFSLNRAAHAALGDPMAVELLYDREASRIGLRKCDPEVEHAYAVRGLRTGGTWLISGTAFTQYYGIDTPVARRWTAELEDDVLIIDLKEPGTEVAANRAAGRANAPEDSPEGATPPVARGATVEPKEIEGGTEVNSPSLPLQFQAGPERAPKDSSGDGSPPVTRGPS